MPIQNNGATGIGAGPLLVTLEGITEPTTIYYLDGNRTDSYTQDGSIAYPYKTLSTLATGVASVSGPFAIVVAPTPSAYTYTGNLSFPAYFMTITGNDASWSFTGNVQLNAAFNIQNLNTTVTGTLTYAATSATESIRNNGSLIASGGIFTSGYEHFFNMSILSNTLVTLNSGATPVFSNVVGTPRFATASGSTALTVLTILNCNILLSSSSSNRNIDMSNGGTLVVKGAILQTGAAVYNIYLPNTNSLATSHLIEDVSYTSGLGLYASSSTYYAYSNLSIDPVGALGYALYNMGSSSSHPMLAFYASAIAASTAIVSPSYTNGTTLTALSDTVFGSGAGNAITSGLYNSAYGFQAGYSNSTGGAWTAVGYSAGYSSTGSNWTAVGNSAGRSSTTSSNWTAIGYYAGRYIADGSTINTTGSNSVWIGYQAYPNANGDTNETVIGYTAVGAGSNTVVLGNSSTTAVYLGNSTATPAASAILHTAGIFGITDGSSAAAGIVGQVISSTIASGSAVSLTTATPANVTSISLTAGDWDVSASVNFVGASTTIVAGAAHEIGINSTTATLPTDGTEVYLSAPILTAASAKFGGALPPKAYHLSSTTTVYLVAEGAFTAGTESAYGTIIARRVR